jgi:hypothetical protein
MALLLKIEGPWPGGPELVGRASLDLATLGLKVVLFDFMAHRHSPVVSTAWADVPGADHPSRAVAGSCSHADPNRPDPTRLDPNRPDPTQAGDGPLSGGQEAPGSLPAQGRCEVR